MLQIRFYKNAVKKISLILVIIFYCKSGLVASELWNGEEGLKRLNRSKYNQDFYQIANFFQPQINPLYCGIASSVAVLNALNFNNIESQKELEVKIPESKDNSVANYKLYSQLNFLNDKTDKIKDRDIIDFRKPKIIKEGKNIYDPGLKLGELSKILSKVYKAKVTVKYIKNLNENEINKFRQELKKILIDKTSFIIVNYDRKAMNQDGSGHFSIISAYDDDDYVLIMDAATHKYLWSWEPLEQLLSAMNTKDGDEYRGYLVVSKAK